MLIYASSGLRDLVKDPVSPKTRGAWEFFALLEGSITIDLGDPTKKNDRQNGPTLWAFPPDYRFGLMGCGSCERAVFDFTDVPEEMRNLIPRRGYYRVSLSIADCDRLRGLSRTALEALESPTQLTPLQQQSMAAELALLVMREVRPQGLAHSQIANTKVQHALAWYASSLTERPGLEDVAGIVRRSPAQLRRLFHQVRGESPKAAFFRTQMEKVDQLLCDSSLTLSEIAVQVGLSGPSALIRSVKKFYGVTPGQLRKRSRLQAARNG